MILLQPTPKARESLKRKGVEQVSDDFSHFSLSAPAPKIRRLDAEMLGPIMEEAELDPVEIEASPSPSPERSIVVYKPFLGFSNNNSNLSFSLHSDFSHLTKNPFLASSSHRPDQSAEEPESEIASRRHEEDCMAVVPWVGLEPQQMEIEQEEGTCMPPPQQLHALPQSHYYQHHCVPHHLPHSATTLPVGWFS